MNAVILLGLSRPHHEQSGVSLPCADHIKGAAGLEQQKKERCFTVRPSRAAALGAGGHHCFRYNLVTILEHVQLRLIKVPT